jgi:hypothetical protein
MAMSKIVWLKIGAVAALWAIIVGSAVSGWMIGRSDAARQISDLRQRLAFGSAPKASCGVEIELIEARTGKSARGANLFGLTLSGILPPAPYHLHLREMLTAR